MNFPIMIPLASETDPISSSFSASVVNPHLNLHLTTSSSSSSSSSSSATTMATPFSMTTSFFSSSPASTIPHPSKEEPFNPEDIHIWPVDQYFEMDFDQRVGYRTHIYDTFGVERNAIEDESVLEEQYAKGVLTDAMELSGHASDMTF